MGVDIFTPFDSDIFLKLHPFKSHITNDFLLHGHEMIISFLLYQVLYSMISPLINGAIFGDFYSTKLSKKAKLNFDIHTVSMVQCILSILFILPMFKHSNWFENPVFGRTQYGSFVAACTVGYFIWDLIICLRHYSLFGPGFLLHAFASLYVFITTFIYCQPWIPGFLIFELSTPFVNINWFISKLPENSINTKFTLINGLLLILTFFLVRILWGFYAAFLLIMEYSNAWNKIDYKFVPFTTISLNIMLNSLNVYWLSKMIKIAKKKLVVSSKAKEE
ncbi:hypothetical protein PACTADRAFT_41714 [Pachysolen tannophilus NRRL Y-2460]|uniref:TLC domain-containing protein n=1 Tax=Pachysolen tannophilus NRRL Y-2460 TaxID=669874 RepID=A0A1E4TVG8_PACTA|nr:hypothetical protein PACTADRAFT_41714 [Pachysolen tannophilus NRRL Y-2460]